MFEKLAEEGEFSRAAVRELLLEDAEENLMPEQPDGERKAYEIDIQGVLFEPLLTADELEQCVNLAIDLTEELKNIANNGMDRKAFEDLLGQMREQNPEVERNHEYADFNIVIAMWNKFPTEGLKPILDEIDEVRHVGGAYAMLMVNPALFSAIFSAYDYLVDRFDDPEAYCTSAHFLLQNIMRSGCMEVGETDEAQDD